MLFGVIVGRPRDFLFWLLSCMTSLLLLRCRSSKSQISVAPHGHNMSRDDDNDDDRFAKSSSIVNDQSLHVSRGKGVEKQVYRSSVKPMGPSCQSNRIWICARQLSNFPESSTGWANKPPRTKDTFTFQTRPMKLLPSPRSIALGWLASTAC